MHVTIKIGIIKLLKVFHFNTVQSIYQEPEIHVYS